MAPKYKFNAVTGNLDLVADLTETIAFNDLSDMPGGDISVGKVTYTSLDPAIPTPTLDLVLTAGDTSASNNLTLTNGTLTSNSLTDGTATLTGGVLSGVAITDYVPYTGATGNVDIGVNDFSATNGDFSGDLTVGGNVGIGTTAPTQLLHVKSAGTAGILTETTGTGAYSTFTAKSDGGQVYVVSRGATHTGTSFDNNNADTSQIYSIAQKLLLGTYYADDLVIGTNNHERMRILSGGNVGIGTTSPGEKLEVNGTVLVKDKLKITQDDGNEYIDSLNDGYVDVGATTGIRLLTDTVVTGSVDASTGFKDNGTAGIDTTFVDADGNTITVSGGIIVSKVAP